MPDDFYRSPRPRNEGRPIRGFKESHPTFLRNVLVLIAIAALVYLTLEHFVLAH